MDSFSNQGKHGKVCSTSKKLHKDAATKLTSKHTTSTNHVHAPPIKREFLYTSNYKKDEDVIRVMQWNILADALGSGLDNFICCPKPALEWDFRKVRILEEILKYYPDVLCCQEVDHFHDFLNPSLAQVGYKGVFAKKPYSPCLDVAVNNGPDGCAIFYRRDKFDMVMSKRINLLADEHTTNQVAILLHLQLKDAAEASQLVVMTTHLKAKVGFEEMRAFEGEDILQHLNSHAKNTPLVLTGDFNATPSESCYSILSTSTSPLLSSAYKDGDNEEPVFTTWCIREQGEFPKTLDYIWYSPEQLNVVSKLEMPKEKDVPKSRLPCFQYPSDHLSLVCDFQFK